MASYSVAEAKNQLPRLIDKARAGEEVVITRHGKVVAEVCRPRSRLTPEEREALYDRMEKALAKQAPLDVSAVDLIRMDRDEGP
jgi:antitoxin (DNA-binding transcriptional repressor) of toxin-antitoxin stability system